MRAVAIGLVAAWGCSFHDAQSPSDGGGGGDAARDGAVTGDTSGTRDAYHECYGSGLLQVCATAPPPPTYDINTNTTIDTVTDCDSNVTVNESNMCVKIAQQINITHELSATGSQPIVLVATDTLVISARVDASSHDSGAVDGPGANSTACGMNHTPNNNEGGPGGSFGGQGGPGSNGGVTAAGAQPRPTSVRGGCRGTDGGGPGGAGGSSGGAVYLIAGTSITVMSVGSIDASGAGGHGGVATDNGAGGGGSGGSIALDAPMVINLGQIFASGGGGGEGGQGVTGADGGEASSPTAAASGGSGNTTQGGNGGIGSFGTTKAGGSGDIGGGGAGDGGGGGGAGYILVFGGGAISGNGTIAPPAQ